MLQRIVMDKSPIISRMPPGMLEAYLRFEITSFDVAQALGVNPASVRRAIPAKKRVRPESQTSILKERKIEKQRLRETRKAYRASLAHLPIEEIMKRANVAKTLAYKIKKQYDTTKS